MAFNRIADFSIDANINLDFKGINVSEGMARNLVNNAMRALASMIKADTSSVTPTITAASTFTLASISTGDYVLMAPPSGLSLTSFGTGVPGQYKWLEATGAFILRNSANLAIQGGADVSISTGDLIYARCQGSTAYKAYILRGDGRATVDGSLGKHLIPVPARGMQPMSLSGAAFTTVETATNKFNYAALLFDNSATEYAYFELVMPKSYNSGTITFKARSESVSGVGGVKWALDAAGVSDGDATDAAWGTAGTVTVSFSAADRLAISAESSAITIGNSITANDTVQFRVSRSPQDAADTLAADARLRGVDVFITTNAPNDS